MLIWYCHAVRDAQIEPTDIKPMLNLVSIGSNIELTGKLLNERSAHQNIPH